MYAIVEINKKQYKVSVGDIVFVDRMEEYEVGAEVTFDNVLLIADDKKTTIGDNYIKNAKVKATIISHGKDKKIVVFKMKAKKNERKTQGHRQPNTKIQIEKIITKTEKIEEVKTEVIKEVKKEIKADVKKEVKADVKKEVKAVTKTETKKVVKKEVKG